jgi:uncharacterized protein
MAHQDIRGVALVGSHARGTARPDSDIDLIVLAERPSDFRADASWLGMIDWSQAATQVETWQDKDYGAVWSRHVLLATQLELEISFAPPSWASVMPLDAGTRQVVAEGCRVLHDPDGLLAELCSALSAPPR